MFLPPRVHILFLRAKIMGWGCIVFVMLLAWHALPAAAAPPLSLRFETLTQEHGLPHQTIFALLQDKQGFIWLGTQGGLVRYDGYRAIVFQHDLGNPNSLPDSWIFSLHEDLRGQLWVGTRSGLARFDPEKNGFTRYLFPDLGQDNTKQSRVVRVIEADGQGAMWLATEGGLQRFDPESGRFQAFLHNPKRPASIASDNVLALARSADGGLWVGTQEGLDYLPPKSTDFSHFRLTAQAARDLPDNRVQALRIDDAQALWIGTAKGVTVWNPGSEWTQRRGLAPPAGVESFQVNAIYQDKHANLWLTTAQNGLLLWDKIAQRFSVYRHQPGDTHSLAADRTLSVTHDRSGTLWVGTWEGGASRTDLDSGGFERFIHRPGDPGSLPDSPISAQAEDGGGHLWVGTFTGLYLFDPVRGHVLRSYRHEPGNPDSLSDDRVFFILPEADGRLWIGTRAGLNLLDRKSGRLRRVRLKIGSSSENFTQVARASDGVLWLGSFGGLTRYDPKDGSVRQFRYDPANSRSISDNFALTVLVDSRERIWVGTMQGLDLLDQASGNFTHYRHDPRNPNSLSSDRIQYLFEDGHGTLWIGTANGVNRGVSSKEGGLSFRAYTSRDGLAHNSVSNIQPDAAGRLWLGTSDGLARLDPASGKISNFKVRDGLINGYFLHRSSKRGSDGTLYFGGAGGLIAFRPEAIAANPFPPPMAFTDISIFNRSIIDNPPPPDVALDGPLTQAKTLKLPWHMSVFSLEFAALHYADPSRNRYAYRLEGFDRDWMETDAAHRTATYTHLDPGSYVFRVKVANKDGVWNNAGGTLRIVITPPFWMTWWFRLLAAAALLAIAVSAYRWRIGRLARRQAHLERLVAERTSELSEQKKKVEERTLELAAMNQELHQAYYELENVSLTDPLTGLRNRRFLDQRLHDDLALTLRRYEEAAEDASQGWPDSADLVFFMVDIDHFKAVNDKYSHAVGDQVLIQLRHRLENVFRDSDYLVRWGGEEFLVVARGANQEGAANLAERVCSSVGGKDFEVDGALRLSITCSVGFACFPFFRATPHRLSWQQVAELADQGLYAAKRAGRNAWVGLYGTDANPPGDILARLEAHPAEILNAGAFQIRSSLPEAAIVAAWPSAH